MLVLAMDDLMWSTLIYWHNNSFSSLALLLLTKNDVKVYFDTKMPIIHIGN